MVCNTGMEWNLNIMQSADDSVLMTKNKKNFQNFGKKNFMLFVKGEILNRM